MISPDPKLPFLDAPEKWLSRFVERFYRLWRELRDYLVKLDARVVTLEGLSPAGTTWTPTLTNVANLSGTPTAVECYYMTVGNTVMGGGQVNANTITAGTTLTQLRISLPIASAFTQAYHLSGGAGNAAFDPAYIKADATNDAAELNWFPASTAASSKTLWFWFIYKKI